MTSIEDRIKTAVAADTSLQALLGTPPATVRWYTGGLMQGSAVPAVVTQLISVMRIETHSGTLTTKQYRVQCKIFGGQAEAGKQACADVGAAIDAFRKTLNLTSRSASLQQPNFIENERDTPYSQQDRVNHLKMLDLLVFADD